MAKPVKIVTASHPGLPLETIVRHEIGVIPLIVTGADEATMKRVTHPPIYGLPEEVAYSKQYEATSNALFELLEQRRGEIEAAGKGSGITLPGTSQPNEGFVREYLNQVFQRTKCEEILILSIFHKDSKHGNVYSGTFPVVEAVAASFNGKVKAIDSHTLSAGLGVLALYASRKAKKGMGLEGLAETVNSAIPDVVFYTAIEDMYFTLEGGRLSHLKETIMRISRGAGLDKYFVPIMEIRHGSIGAGGIALTWSQEPEKKAASVNHALLKKLPKGKKIEFVAVVYTSQATRSAAESLRKELAKRLGLGIIPITQIGPEVGVHAGTSAWGYAFLNQNGAE